ncbi:hypothetical protein ACIQOW_06370 [Kitasatospora sp. NPDC091335]|uniref:hypothetical protein n=1 Tax=Kitasatospora sp. NPDC091335 TaxID=3364085 RepID=UPI0037F1CF0F
MSRFRAAAAVTALGAFLLLGAGAATAHADAGAGAGAGAPDRSNGSTVNDSGSGNIIGNVHGNVVNTQQAATGSGAGAGNQDNGLAVTGNTGSVESHQNNGNGGGS